MRFRIVILPIAAAILVTLCAYRFSRPPKPRSIPPPTFKRPAPLFELYDQKKPSKLVRLESYVGRHQILVVFFDGTAGVEQDPVLRRLRQNFENIKATGTIVLAVSTALPQENRPQKKREGDLPQKNRNVGVFPFPLLSDPGLDVQRNWGRLDEPLNKPLTGVFLIDRAGLVGWSQPADAPEPTPHPERVIDHLIQGH